MEDEAKRNLYQACRRLKHIYIYIYIYIYTYIHIYIYIYRVSQEERTKLREGVPYVKLYRYNPKTYIQS